MSGSLSTCKAAIFGCAGLRLTEEEKRFFREHKPVGFILFARNCESPEQVKALVASLKEVAFASRAISTPDFGGSGTGAVTTGS